VVEMAYRGGDHASRQPHLPGHAKHCRGHVTNRAVDDDLAPMETKIADPVHRVNRMVNAMNTPQKRYTMQQVVYAPLYEIHDEHCQRKLRPKWQPAEQFEARRLCAEKRAQKRLGMARDDVE
jgi:hypothetical protein